MMSALFRLIIITTVSAAAFAGALVGARAGRPRTTVDYWTVYEHVQRDLLDDPGQPEE